MSSSMVSPNPTDHWEVLGLEPGANQQALKQAFRRLARRWHPDLNANDPVAEERFKRINEAYAVLSDPSRRGLWEGGDQKEEQDPFATGFPDFETKLVTETGDAICQKQDIFKGLMWFAYTNNFANWHVLKIEKVKEIIAENKLKNKVSSLEDFAIEIIKETEKDFNNAMGQESLTRFDQPKKSKKTNKKHKQPGENAIVPNNKKQANNNASAQNDKKPAPPRKPIIITKNETKK